MTGAAGGFATVSTIGEEGIGAVGSTATFPAGNVISTCHVCCPACTSASICASVFVASWGSQAVVTTCSLQIRLSQHQWCMRRGLLWLRRLGLRQHIRWIPQRRGHLPRLPVL